VARLRDELGGRLRLMRSTMRGEVVAAGLFSEHRGIVQAILVGVDGDARRWSPLKVMLDDVRAWAHRRGDRVLHLGGGRGGREDSLYQFTSRFSGRRHRSFTGRWVIDPAGYAKLTAAHARRALAMTGVAPATDWFPAYRAPVGPRPRVAVPISTLAARRVALPVDTSEHVRVRAS
jgi:hypothetical protein